MVRCRGIDGNVAKDKGKSRGLSEQLIGRLGSSPRPGEVS